MYNSKNNYRRIEPRLSHIVDAMKGLTVEEKVCVLKLIHEENKLKGAYEKK